MEPRRRISLERYRTDLRTVVGSSATPYGYTLTVWSTGMVLSDAYGPPGLPQILAFLLGAVAAFVAVGLVAFGGVTAEFGGGSNRIQLWGAFHFLSIGLAVSAAWLISALAPGYTGWPLAAFVATGAYLLIVGLERTAADREG